MLNGLIPQLHEVILILAISRTNLVLHVTQLQVHLGSGLQRCGLAAVAMPLITLSLPAIEFARRGLSEGVLTKLSLSLTEVLLL